MGSGQARRTHTFQVVSDGAALINACASRTTVPRLDEIVSTLGVPLQDRTLPAPLTVVE